MIKSNTVKQRFFEAGSSEFSISISRVKSSDGSYIYMLDSSDQMYDYLDLRFPVFNTWVDAWNYVKENYPGWWNFKPFFIHQKVHAFLLLELKKQMRELSIASKKFWTNCIRPFWKSCFKEDLQELLN